MQVNTKVMLILLWGIVLFLDPTSVSSQNTSVDAHIISKTLTRILPDSDGKPVRVEVGIFFIDVINVDELTESFEADFLLSLKWQDPRLSMKALGFSLEDYRLSLSDIWHPSIHPINQRGISREQDRDVILIQTALFAFQSGSMVSSRLLIRERFIWKNSGKFIIFFVHMLH